jgi:drug/metabolite transporter (DMT)-like permease
MPPALSYAHEPPWRSVAALLINALVFGLSWWPFRWLQNAGLHPLWATAIASACAVLLISLSRPSAWLEIGTHPGLWLLALASGLTNVGFNWAVTTGDVVRVVLLFYLMPAWSLLLAWPMLGERPNQSALIRLALALGGMALVLKSPEHSLPWPQSLSDWLGLLGGVFFALTNVLLRRLNHTSDGARMLAMFVGGLVLAGLGATAAGRLQLAGPMPDLAMGWLGMTVLLGLSLLLANLALQYGAARLPAGVTAVVMLSEVVFASVSSVSLGAANMSPRIALGGALILAASLWSVRSLRVKT